MSDIKFTPRQLTILIAFAEGLQTKEIAAKHHLSNFTVETHRNNIYTRGKFHSYRDLLFYAIKEGLIHCPCRNCITVKALND